jgi:hypothetical protein
LTSAEAAMAVGDEDGARAAIRAARDRIVYQAEQIKSPEIRASFLSKVAENARTLELARAWGAAT